MFNLKYKFVTRDEEFKSLIDVNQYDECVYNTFKYMFNKFKKGIFIHIKNQTIHKFIIFNKLNYINESAEKIIFEDQIVVNRYTLFNLNGYISDDNDNHIEADYIFKMITRCLELYKISDCTFFINPNPFPILSLDYTEPYTNIWGEDVKLISHKYDLYTDILSMTSSKNYIDISIPNWLSYDTTFNIDSINWDEKINKAVFRGTSIGFGTLVRNNPRLKILKLGKENPGLLDVGITEWKQQYRKRPGDNEYKIVPDKIIEQYSTVKDLSLNELANYKYIINLPGYTSNYNFSKLFKLGSVILHIPNEENHLWFEPMLKPYIHYVPLDKDLKNLKSQIQWCKKNQEICKNIIKNAFQFYKEYLTCEKQISFLHLTLNQLNNYYSSESYLKFEYTSSPIVDINEDELVQVNDDMFKTDKYLLKKYNDIEMYNYFKYITSFTKSYLTHTGEYFGWRIYHGRYKEYMVMDLINPNVYTSLYEYLCLANLDFTIVQDCILQVCILLDNIYKSNKFVHNNCDSLWNIMIHIGEPKTVYIQNGQEEYIFNTCCTVYIIDYEKGFIGEQKECRDVFKLLINIFYLILINTHYYPQHVINLVVQLYHEIFPYSNSIYFQDIINTLKLFKDGDDYELKLINSKIDLTNYIKVFKLLQTYFPLININKRKINESVDKLFQQYIKMK